MFLSLLVLLTDIGNLLLLFMKSPAPASRGRVQVFLSAKCAILHRYGQSANLY